MRPGSSLRFRTKLWSLAIATALVLAAVAVVSTSIGLQQARDLATLEERLVPRLELGPQLVAQLDRLRQSLQDAAAAQDREALAATLAQRDALLDKIRSSRALMDPAVALELERAVADYHDAGHEVSRRLIVGETGEALADAVAGMQSKQRRASDLVERATAIDRDELAGSFATVRRASESANRFGLAMSLGGVVLVVGLSLWMGRGVLRTVGHMSSGFARFGAGDFDRPIPITTGDELGDAAHEANLMAEKLRRLAAERDRTDWLKSGVAGLAHELRGELEPEEVASRALRFLAPRARSVAGALYLIDADGALTLSGTYARSGAAEAGARFDLGEGLVGQAALARDLQVVEGLPAGYVHARSGLGDTPAQALLLLPLVRLDRVLGVLELALMAPPGEDVRELLQSVGETVALALEVAQSRRALTQRNAELEDARRRLQDKAEELGKVSTYKSQFLANMSHELRTPLNSMLLLSHLLAENEGKNLTPKQVEFASTVHASGKDLLQLINQILDLAKIESGKQVVHLEPIELDAFSTFAQRTMGPLATEKGLRLEVEVERGLPASLVTDELRVQRILTNLLGNAIKFTEQGAVTLRIGRPATGVHLGRAELAHATTVAFAVKDSGIGIAAEHRARVFAPFEQLEARSNRRYAGTGLGLAIARESATLLGGELQLESEVGRGSTFTCYLPERPSPATTIPLSRSTTPTGTIEDDRRGLEAGEPHLLIVEDDLVVARQLMGMVRERGLKAVVALDGESGLQLALQYRPRAVVLDVRLPDMDGWEVMSRLREDEATTSIPIHIVSAIDERDRGLAMGAVGYLTKPATRDELAEVIATLVPAPAPERPAAVDAPPIDLARRTILIVDDDMRTAYALSALLRGRGAEVLMAENGVEALAILDATPGVDGVLMDVMMPVMDGYEATRRLRADRRFTTLPVVALTAKALAGERERCLEAGASEYLAKPVDPAALLAVLGAVVGGGAAVERAS